MVDEIKIRQVLTDLLLDITGKARSDALNGRSDISQAFGSELPFLKTLDDAAIKQAILDIHKATATKETSAKLLNAILSAAKIIAITTIG